MRITSFDPLPREKQDSTDVFENFKYSNDATVLSSTIVDFYERPSLRNARKLLQSYNVAEPMRNRKPKSFLIHGGAIPASKEVFKELLALDTLHDLENSKKPHVIFKSITNNLGVEIPKHLKEDYMKGSRAFTYNASQYISIKQGLQFFSATNKEESEVFDYVLKSRGIEKMNDDLTIVLDNIIASIRYDATLHEATIGFMGCAFLLVLYNNLAKSNKLPPNARMVFADGLFIRMDGNYIRRFLVLFARSMKRATKAKEVILDMYQDGISQPNYFNNNFDTDVKLDYESNSLQFNGNSYNIGITNESAKTISYPHSKKQFQEVVEANVNNKDFWYLNFLRDAFKADVALQRDCIFMTHDRLAHLYYKLNGGKKGFLIISNPRDGFGGDYKVYA